MTKQQSHYYSATAGSALGRQLAALRDSITAANRAADQWARQQGAHSFYPRMDTLGGGVSALIFPDPDSVDPAAWRTVGTDGDGDTLWAPADPDGETERTRRELPVVRMVELTSLLGIDITAGASRTGQDRLHVTRVESPDVFEQRGRYYVRSLYPCGNPDLTPVIRNVYKAEERAMRKARAQKQ